LNLLRKIETFRLRLKA